MSDTRDPETDQALPIPTGGPVIQHLVIADVQDRLEHGIRKYGTGLQVGNGRDMAQDAYEEVLDLAVYLRGLLAEREGMVMVPRAALEALIKEYLDCAERADEGHTPQWLPDAAGFIDALGVEGL